MRGGVAGDFLQGTAEANLLFGNEGADTILGGAQRRDTLRGGKDNDSIGFFTGAGGGDNNLGLNLSGGGSAGNEGSNYLLGDLGNDLVVGINQRDTLYGGKGNDTLRAYGNNNYVSGDDDNDTLTVINSKSQFGTTTDLTVGIEKVTLLGGAGNDSISGGIGNFQSGKNFYDGGDGNDNLVSRAFQDTLLGGAGNDFLRSETSPGLSSQNSPISSPGYAGSSLLDGGVGNDTIIAGFANDTMIGGDGNDSLSGIFTQAGGGDGDDTIDARLFVLPAGSIPTQITLDGGAGNDRLWGNTSSTNAVNVFNDGAGNDFIVFGSTGDTLIGSGEGNDTISCTTVNFTGTGTNVISDFLGNNLITGGNGIDSITTGSGNDILIGGLPGQTISDTLDGGAGDDSLYGDFGDDNLIGGDGNDTLIGGPGADILTGGNGNDTYVFFTPFEGQTAVGGQIDAIVGFVVGQDKIALSLSALSTTSPGFASYGLTPLSSGAAPRPPFDRELRILETGTADGSQAEAGALPGAGFLVYEKRRQILFFDTNGADPDGLQQIAFFATPNTSITESDITLF